MIVKIENSPQDRREEYNVTFLHPLSAPLRFSQRDFSFAPGKRSRSISDPQEVISGRSDYTHKQRTVSGLQVQRTLIPTPVLNDR